LEDIATHYDGKVPFPFSLQAYIDIGVLIVIINAATGYHGASAKALILGLGSRKKRTGRDTYLIHVRTPIPSKRTTPNIIKLDNRRIQHSRPTHNQHLPRTPHLFRQRPRHLCLRTSPQHLTPLPATPCRSYSHPNRSFPRRENLPHYVAYNLWPRNGLLQ
jgi:hypothetical protein